MTRMAYTFVLLITMIAALLPLPASSAQEAEDQLTGSASDSQMVSMCQITRHGAFSSESEICFHLNDTVVVTIVLKTPLGETVRALVQERLPAGHHTFAWDGLDDRGQPVTSGVYLYEIKANNIARSDMLALLD